MTTSHRILLVGHCGPDAHMLASAARRAVPGAEVEIVNDARRLEAALPVASLLLVNRVLDGDLGSSGVELIRSLKGRGGGRPEGQGGEPGNGAGPAAMLISNFEDAQQEAEAAGAAPGFGKRAVMTDQARARIRVALGLEP